MGLDKILFHRMKRPSIGIKNWKPAMLKGPKTVAQDGEKLARGGGLKEPGLGQKI